MILKYFLVLLLFRLFDKKFLNIQIFDLNIFDVSIFDVNIFDVK